MSISTTPPLTQTQKLELWNDKKSNWNKDITLKVAAVALLSLLGISLAAGFAMSIYFAPVLGIGLACGLGFPSFFGFCGAWGAARILLREYFDWTNYKKPENVTLALSKIKNAHEPLPMHDFKRLHRYGIVSDSELERRESMESLAKEYAEAKADLRSMQKRISLYRIEIEKLENLPSHETQKILNEARLTGTSGKISEVESKIAEIEAEFTAFHQSIVDFDPGLMD